MEILKVLRCTDGLEVILVLENRKKISRKLKKDTNNYSYFIYKKEEYFLNKLHLLNIELTDDI